METRELDRTIEMWEELKNWQDEIETWDNLGCHCILITEGGDDEEIYS